MSSDVLQTAQFSFIDSYGRKIHLRGVNLSGASKAPIGQPSHILRNFWESAEAGGESFVGQPLNLDDGSADEHLARLRGWGFNLLRFPITWEALEHAGPKKYDYEYMDYIVRVLLKCKEYGFRVYLDPHQDVWSRFSGGSGAPLWTLYACGINPYHLSATQSALIHCEWPLPHQVEPESFPGMIWGTNYGRLLSQTLFTLFFAGRTFASSCIIDNMNIQDYLQSHYINALGQLADRIKRADEEEGAGLLDSCVIGWDSMNEPAEGLIEWDDLHKNPTEQGTTVQKGTIPTPVQSLRLGMGQAQTVDHWTFGAFGPKRDGSMTIDPKGRKVWADPSDESGELSDGTNTRWGWKRDVSKWQLGTCIWAQHGVWDVESGYVLRPDYFKYDPETGIEVDFMSDFWVPYFKSYAKRIRQAHPQAILFIQPPVFAYPPSISEDVLQGRCVYTGHYYDGLTLMTKHWNWFNADSLGVLRGKYKSPIQAVKFGEKAIRKSIMEQIAELCLDAKLITAPPNGSDSQTSIVSEVTKPNEYPTVIGEIGTPFDMDDKYAYFRSRGDYSKQEKALDASLNACDGYNNVAYTTWTYLPNGHTHEWGDGWNGEDLSLWSSDDLRSTYIDQAQANRASDMSTSNGLEGLRQRKVTPKNVNPSQVALLTKTTTINQGFASENQSSITLATLPGIETSVDAQYEQSESSPTSLLPSATNSAPTMMLSKKPSVAFSTLTVMSGVDSPPSKMQPEQAHALASSSTLATTNRDGDPENDPYDFLTDGTRAVKAFCRPRPVKVWGEVANTTFDISKAEFKCIIKAPASFPVDVNGDDEELATEFYLPLVHFASRELLENSKARWDPATMKKLGLKAPKRYGVDFDFDDDQRVPKGKGTCGRLLEGIEDREDLLDVEVKVSGGRWKIKGQTLFWWYPASPNLTSVSKGGDNVGEYTLEVKRRGGAIKTRKGGWVEMKSWMKPQQLAQQNDDPCTALNFCQQVCDGCVLM